MLRPRCSPISQDVERALTKSEQINAGACLFRALFHAHRLEDFLEVWAPSSEAERSSPSRSRAGHRVAAGSLTPEVTEDILNMEPKAVTNGDVQNLHDGDAAAGHGSPQKPQEVHEENPDDDSVPGGWESDGEDEADAAYRQGQGAIRRPALKFKHGVPRLNLPPPGVGTGGMDEVPIANVNAPRDPTAEAAADPGVQAPLAFIGAASSMSSAIAHQYAAAHGEEGSPPHAGLSRSMSEVALPQPAAATLMARSASDIALPPPI